MAAEDEFAQRVTLGLAATTPALRLDGTLTRAPEEAPPPPPAATASLPRISLASPAPAGELPTHSHSADLTVLKTLGEGGMGRVRLARQRSLARDVAVKSLKTNATAGAARALLEEARITGALEHPGVIPVHALGLDDDGGPVLVMKRVEGEEWRLKLAGEERTPERLAANVELLMQVAQTMEFAHTHGVLHLDVKPENVMVGHFGEVYLVDWGVAMSAEEASKPRNHLVGTPAYMAPEMVLGKPLTVQSDVYLLGATLHHLITGEWRHGGPSVQQVLEAAARSVPVQYGSQVPASLASLANRATSADPAMRPRSAAAFRTELAAYLRSRGAEALAREARARLEECRALLAPEGVPTELPRTNKLLTEARFGFEQSLRELPGHGPARDGLLACTLLQVELELRLGHGSSARALLSEVPHPEPELVKRVEAAEAKERDREAAAGLLKDLLRDASPKLGRRARFWVLMIFAAAVFAVSLAFAVFEGIKMTAWGLARVNAALALLGVVSVAVYRRQFTGNSFNRKLLGVFLVMLFGTLQSRLIGASMGLPVNDVLVLDLTVYTAVLASAATTTLRSLWWPAAASLTGLTIARLYPPSTRLTFSIANLLVLLVSAWVLERHARLDAEEGKD